MASSGVQSPLGVNLLGSLLASTGLTINPVSAGYMGSSKNNATYTFGSILNTSGLRLLTLAINDGYLRGINTGATITSTTYNELISIGSTSIPALGNAPSSTYTAVDPAGVWTNTAVAYGIQQGISGALPGPATSGYPLTSATGQGQEATWLPYNTTNPNVEVTQWGFIRLFALQAWNEFNWNGTSVSQTTPGYSDFCSSLTTAASTLISSNQTINSVANSSTFLEGTYSNMNDLITADISGVNLSTQLFGTDLVNLGKAIDLSQIATFGLPSNLLRTLGQNSAITSELNIALLSAGLSSSDISNITGVVKNTVSTQTEKQIYGAFLIIIGDNLSQILAPIQCVTPGLNSLADLLNVQKLFPLSYASLTVPIYNASSGPTNSKTYYLLYQNGGVNTSALDSPIIQSYIGTIIPSGTPPIFSQAVNPQNYSQLPQGFSSYLRGIIPYNQAVAAGAFSYAMQQISNIQNVNIQKFAAVVSGIENTNNLDLIGGTNVPTNQTSASYASSVQALGSGPNGSITLSDYFGCMSGLPYPWQLIQQRIINLQTTNLYNIYQQMFLATTWEQATASNGFVCTPAYTSPGTYTITGITLTDAGGGYSRGSATGPTVTFTSGGSTFSTTAIIDTSDTDAGSNDNGTFGRVIGIVPFSATLTAAPSTYSVSIQAPPTSNSGGTNTAAGTVGWPTTMNSVVQYYIGLANTEIMNIQTNNPDGAKHLNAYWNILGSQLKREQRTRYTNIPPVAVPKNLFLNSYASSLNNFVNSIPQLAQDTSPHGSAQTLEAIADLTTVGGQSLVGLMREFRNQTRLQQAGIDLYNNIPNTSANQQVLAANGTVSGAVEGIPGCGAHYTIPAWPSNLLDTGDVLTPIPNGVYITGTGYQQLSGNSSGDITQILNCQPNPVAGPIIASGTVINQPTTDVVIIAPPTSMNPSNLPANLNSNYNSGVLFSATPNIEEAIDQVTSQNCDCQVS